MGCIAIYVGNIEVVNAVEVDVGDDMGKREEKKVHTL